MKVSMQNCFNIWYSCDGSGTNNEQAASYIVHLYFINDVYMRE